MINRSKAEAAAARQQRCQQRGSSAAVVDVSVVLFV
jgi:hypothetical protein